VPSSTLLDERSFHRWLAKRLRGPARGLLPVGDDTAALPLGGRRVALLTTDALVEWTHFLPASPPRAVGAAAAAVNLSDLAAKGGTPVALTLDLLLPPETDIDWAEEVVEGADATLRAHGAALVGGDTKASRTPAVVGNLLGIGRSDRLVPRSAARPGDLLATTGRVGAGGLAYRRLVERGPTDRAALDGLLAVEPRLREGRLLAGLAHAVLDTSDGIGEGCRLLAEASRVRLEVDAAQLPLVAGLRGDGAQPVPPETFFGGDYELLAAIPAGRAERAVAAIRKAGGTLTVIGRVRRGDGAWLVGPDGPTAMPGAGFRNFR
jgi:thiamine-monophosphate kinase